LEPLPDVLRTDANKVRGCASQVWLSASTGQDAPDAPSRLHFLGDSDAHIVRGLIAILFAMYQDRTPEEILATDARAPCSPSSGCRSTSPRSAPTASSRWWSASAVTPAPLQRLPRSFPI
jgi:hypothetical protein